MHSVIAFLKHILGTKNSDKKTKILTDPIKPEPQPVETPPAGKSNSLFRITGLDTFSHEYYPIHGVFTSEEADLEIQRLKAKALVHSSPELCDRFFKEPLYQ